MPHTLVLILLLLAGLFNIRHKLFERKGNGLRSITPSELSEQQPLVPENGHPSPAHLSFFDNNPMPMLILFLLLRVKNLE